MSQLTVEVTEADIRKGVRCGSTACPVALAVARTLLAEVRVSPSYMALEWHNASLSVPLPAEVGHFVIAFDAGRPVEPFAFTVELPGWVRT